MKKVLITAAVIFTVLLAVCIAFVGQNGKVKAAESEDAFNLDYVLLQTPDAFVENMGKGADLGNISNVVKKTGAMGIALIGWYFPEVADSIADFGYQIDDEEIVYGAMGLTANNDVIAAIASWGGKWAERASSTRNFSGTIPLREGAHTVRFIVKFNDGGTKVLYQSSYINDDSDIALNKPVVFTTNGIKNASGYWADNFVADGYNPVHNPAVVADPVPLGIYAGVTEGHVTGDIYIDLLGIYDLSKVSIRPQGFAQAAFPNTYNVYTSMDGVNWDKIGGEEGRQGLADPTTPYNYTTTNRARFIRMEIISGNPVDESGAEYVSLGEIEAYGTLVEEKDYEPAPYMPAISGNFTSYVGSNAGIVTGDTIWLGFTSGRLSTNITFTTDVPFWAVGFPDYWSSANTPVTLKLTNAAGEVVWTLSYVKAGDGAEGIPFFEDNHELPAGEYTLTITLDDDTKGDDGAYTHWLVVGHGNWQYPDEYIANETGYAAFWLFIKEGVQGDGFVKREYRQHTNTDALQLDGVDQDKANGTNVNVNENSKNILYHGWLAANYQIEKIGYRVDGGKTVYDEGFYGTNEQDNAAIMNAAKSIFSVPGNGYRASINVPVTAGSHTVEIIGLADGEEKVFYTFTYSGIPEPETQPGTEPGTEPETQPATGDAAVAMFAVIAVLAMGAAVVFIKKRAF